MELINTEISEELFLSAYLDEIQDFTYASIYLICSLAGKSASQWVAAGDTAQMISPGCSFKFDGLKNTWRAVDPNVKLERAKQLKRNYRMVSPLEVAPSAR